MRTKLLIIASFVFLLYVKTSFSQTKLNYKLDTVRIIKIKKLDSFDKIIQDANFILIGGQFYSFNNFPFSSISCGIFKSDSLSFYNDYLDVIFWNTNKNIIKDLDKLKYFKINLSDSTESMSNINSSYRLPELINNTILYKEMRLISTYFIKDCNNDNNGCTFYKNIICDKVPILIDYKKIKNCCKKKHAQQHTRTLRN